MATTSVVKTLAIGCLIVGCRAHDASAIDQPAETNTPQPSHGTLSASAAAAKLPPSEGRQGAEGSKGRSLPPARTRANARAKPTTDAVQQVPSEVEGSIDIKNAILSKRSADCADYAGSYTAQVRDVAGDKTHIETLQIEANDKSCTVRSNTIPNHDFQDRGRFANRPNEVTQKLVISRRPTPARVSTQLTQRTYNAVLLNGVVVDLLSAGCYDPASPKADSAGNVNVGCDSDHPWLLDPMAPGSNFRTDSHNAHTQPNGLYHYHGNPMALFDDRPGPDGSPVIGFAADGFPVYGSYFKDHTGTVRKARSSYQLKRGMRPSRAGSPGGAYDGTYNADYEYTGAGDLDECNGMTTQGSYGYYVTDTYPHMMRCFRGTPNPSFDKRGR